MNMPTNQLVNVSEVADMLGISKRTVHQRIGAGRIAPIQKMPGQTGQYLFDRAYIEQIAADERDATQRRSALAAAAAPSAPEDYAIQDERTGAVILHAFHGSIDGGDAA